MLKGILAAWLSVFGESQWEAALKKWAGMPRVLASERSYFLSAEHLNFSLEYVSKTIEKLLATIYWIIVPSKTKLFLWTHWVGYMATVSVNDQGIVCFLSGECFTSNPWGKIDSLLYRFPLCPKQNPRNICLVPWDDLPNLYGRV